LETQVIQRRGSYLYTRAWRGPVVAITLVYATTGVLLAAVDEFLFDSWLARLVLFCLVLMTTAMMWAVYVAMLWAFSREARQSVEVTGEGIREMRGGREQAFIPWAGVREIELAATLVAGASLRVKGNFSEIAISNVDLVITGPMSLRDMHRAFGQTGRIQKLFEQLRAAAPSAALKMNRLARKRLSKHAWARSV
jgi:hypothetical protein